jgi:hypothetical protein
MFSFVPCVPAEGTDDPRFPRPEIPMEANVTSHLKQGKKITKLARLPDALTLWRQVVEEVIDQVLAMATRLKPPRSRTFEPRAQHARGDEPQAGVWSVIHPTEGGYSLSGVIGNAPRFRPRNSRRHRARPWRLN